MPNFAAGGIATPQDAALMMYLGADGIFVGSGIFKSKDPAKLAKQIVEATTYFNKYDMLRDSALNFGEPMHGTANVAKADMMQERGESN